MGRFVVAPKPSINIWVILALAAYTVAVWMAADTNAAARTCSCPARTAVLQDDPPAAAAQPCVEQAFADDEEAPAPASPSPSPEKEEETQVAVVEEAGHRPRSPYFTEPLDLRQVLGEHGALDGILWEPYICFGGFKKSAPKLIGGNRIAAKLKKAIASVVAEVSGASADSVAFNKTFFELLGIPDSGHPSFVKLRVGVTDVAANFAIHSDGSRFCKCGQQHNQGAPIQSVAELGTDGCAEGQTAPKFEDGNLQCIGAFPGALLTGPATIASTVNALQQYQVCYSRPDYIIGFANYYLEQRLYADNWKTFGVETRDEDILLALFDLYYERHHIFLEQRWLGVAVMQDPFDLLVIQNVIFTLKPDVIIETGTANGGSALLWASVLEVAEMTRTKFITMDVNAPESGFGATAETADPTQHKLWKKYVHFIKGFSTDPAVIQQVETLAANATTVLVILDSDHSANNVKQELDAYCHRFVTLNSYCIVEDSKMDRWGPSPGPLSAIDGFLKKTSQFISERGLELKYSQHVRGYLKRIALQ